MVNTDKKIIKFNAYGVINELDLNQIAIEINLKKKFSWEEPLVLKNKYLDKILDKNAQDEQMVMIFAFGSIVFINIEPQDEEKVIQYLKKFKPEIDLKTWNKYVETYGLHISKEKEFEFEDRYVTIPEYNAFYPEIISTIIAKSVALERTEEQVETILDNIEPMIDKLEKGKIQTSNKVLAKAISKILRHEYNSLAYIMILDKPEITWINNDANELYENMSKFFELNDRYKILKEKTNILNDIMQGFTSISHAISGFFIEWIIVLLIVLEVVIMIAELFLK